MNVKAPARKRQYGMKARAESTAATGERILDAAVACFWELPVEQIPLEEVARRADVSVQTVIRRFGGKDGLIAAATEREQRKVVNQRSAVEVGDVSGAVTVLLDHYEELGERVMKMLADEGRSPAMAEIVEQGRRLHRDWCARVFAPCLAHVTGLNRKRRLAQLVAVCDVYTWKLLRKDAGLSRRETELALLELLKPLAEVS